MKAIIAFLLALLTFGSTHAARLVVLVDASTEMPLADIQQGQLRGGIHRDLAQALARKLDRALEVQVLPRKRLAQALESGHADILCTFQPGWLEGRHAWTQAFFPQSELLLTSSGLPRPQAPGDLRGQAVGTVLGFVYPEMEQALGEGFVRSDAPSALANLNKFRLGRVQHMLVDKAFYDYQLRRGMILAAHPPLVVKYQLTRCAVSLRSKVPLADIEAAIMQLQREGAINKLLSNYQ